MKVTIGTRFRYHYADANPEWEVQRKRGGNSWDCVIVDCPDYSGTHKVFGTEEIQGCLKMQDFWKQSTDASTNFYKNLVTGATIHYSNGFGSFVRCVVTPQRTLKPIALVGEWREYDLPRYDQCGNVILGYHVEGIHTGKTMTPHASNIYEFQVTRPPSQRPTGYNVDPRHMTPISLEPKPMTAEQAEQAKYWRQVYHIQSLIKGDNQKGPKAMVDAVRKYLELV